MSFVSTQNWMSALEDHLTLDKISIPGTHDSGTKKAPQGGPRTQNFDIFTQLNDGIRFLDIRVKANGKGGDPLKIYHGDFSCGISLGEVLNDCVTFFQSNPDETIIMLMNAATGSGNDIQQSFDKYLTNADYQNLFYLETSLPNLGQVRGKIVLFRRFPGNVGVDLSNGWLVNKTFTLTTPENQTFRIEDQYKQHNTHKKMSAVESLINEATSNPDDEIMYITYNSISFGGHTPYQYAWGGGVGRVNPEMNPGLEKFLNGISGEQRLGIVMLDFYNNKTGSIDNSNVERIIIANTNVRLNTDVS